jgi:hypothetical protein
MYPPSQAIGKIHLQLDLVLRGFDFGVIAGFNHVHSQRLLWRSGFIHKSLQNPYFCATAVQRASQTLDSASQKSERWLGQASFTHEAPFSCDSFAARLVAPKPALRLFLCCV